MLFTTLLVIHAIIAALLVTVILMQKSEGGGLTSGGSPGGLMSARGAADFLTRATAVLAGLFVAMSITLAVLAATRGSSEIDTSLAKSPAAATETAPAPQDGDALANAAGVAAEKPAPADNSSVPLAQ
ncbi:preprotein translocase subunit SecG [Stakelama marina]|uniref:Protein-export membrane protein SecG n=1 Tax=Stakelama marina TaxID=2826939 RepID=A0A8T4I9A2_9SPHN|nr:preprotein translocase subunit SecG [Stakelama marina]MBR0551227.1 preprotein translocase subunit SecG [Stakelama marina]